MVNRNRGPLLAGAARVDITPQDVTGLTNLWRTPFDGVHDHIFVRALVVDNGINCAAIVAADLVEFGDTSRVREQIEKEIGIPTEHIIITASHDHNAPGLVLSLLGQRHKGEDLKPKSTPRSYVKVGDSAATRTAPQTRQFGWSSLKLRPVNQLPS